MRRALFAIAGVVLAISIGGCGSSGSATSTTAGGSAAAQSACSSIAEGSSSSLAVCAQGYDAAKAGTSQEHSCDHLGSGAVTTSENIEDCQDGWSLAPVAGKAPAATTSSAAAQAACGSVAEGSSSSLAACAQGYDAAKAGASLEQSCDHVGSGAVTAIENVKDCQYGWSVVPVAGKAPAATTSSAAAQAACGSVAEGSSSSLAACAQGYDAAKAGTSQEQGCDHLGSGAVTTVENIKDCQAGWSVG